jgi:hypothetical protein
MSFDAAPGDRYPLSQLPLRLAQSNAKPPRVMFLAVAIDEIPNGGCGEVQLWKRVKPSTSGSGSGASAVDPCEGEYEPDEKGGTVHALDWLGVCEPIRPGDHIYVWWCSLSRCFFIIPPACGVDGSSSGSSSSTGSRSGSDDDSSDTGSDSGTGSDDSGDGSVTASGSGSQTGSGSQSSATYSGSSSGCPCGYAEWEWNEGGGIWGQIDEQCTELECPGPDPAPTVQCGPMPPTGSPEDYDGQTVIRICCVGDCDDGPGGGGLG